MKESIKNREFNDAINQVDLLDFSNVYKALFKYAYEEEDLVYYEFIKYIIDNKKEDAQLQYYAAEMMAMVFNILPDGYEKAFFHAKKAVELAPDDISFKEFILFFFDLPDKLLADDDAIDIAKEILEQNPDNVTAQKVIKTACSTH